MNDGENVVLVCGGRRYADKKRVFDTLDALHAAKPITLLVHGECTGADALADLWAIRRGVDRVKYPANWTGHDKAAGPRRNTRMLNHSQPDLVVAFPGNAGTNDMTSKARKVEVPIVRVS